MFSQQNILTRGCCWLHSDVSLPLLSLFSHMHTQRPTSQDCSDDFIGIAQSWLPASFWLIPTLTRRQKQSTFQPLSHSVARWHWWHPEKTVFPKLSSVSNSHLQILPYERNSFRGNCVNWLALCSVFLFVWIWHHGIFSGVCWLQCPAGDSFSAGKRVQRKYSTLNSGHFKKMVSISTMFSFFFYCIVFSFFIGVFVSQGSYIYITEFSVWK